MPEYEISIYQGGTNRTETVSSECARTAWNFAAGRIIDLSGIRGTWSVTRWKRNGITYRRTSLEAGNIRALETMAVPSV